MTDNVGPEGTEALRRQVLADQAAAKTAAAQTAKKVPAKNKPKAKAAEQAKPALKAPTKKPVAPPPAQARFAATAKITVVAKENPHHQGSKDFGTDSPGAC
jgi:hypothetical protein